MTKLDYLVLKGRELVPRLVAIELSPAKLLIALCCAGIECRNYAETDAWLQQFMCFEIPDEGSYISAIGFARILMESYISEDKCENARELLRKLSVQLQPPTISQKKSNELLTCKLTFLVKYGRTVDLEEEAIEEVYSGTLSRVEKLT